MPSDAISHLSPTNQWLLAQGTYGYYPTIYTFPGYLDCPGQLWIPETKNAADATVKRTFYIGFNNLIDDLEFIDGLYNNPGTYVLTDHIIGFLLGAIAGWRHLQIIQNWFVPIASFGVIGVLFAWFLHTYASYVEVPQKIKLADCTNSVTNIHFKVPKGHDYFIQMDVPGMQQMPNGTVISSYKFSGNIHISDGTAMVTDFPISSEKAWSISSGFVITGISPQNTNAPSLNQLIQAQKVYDLKIELNPPPPPSSSI
ncbi:MAG: hypothetical protein ACREDS_01810 [Limisphaerales bacterium]